MKVKNFLTGIILCSAVFGGSSNATNLCNDKCTLSVTFPNGGAIEAAEPLTITFGNGGLIDTIGSVTAYVEGETLILNATDEITFGSGGSFDIGDLGNIDYLDMVVRTNGLVVLNSSGGVEEIVIPEGGRLALLEGATINIASSININGLLELGENTSLNIFPVVKQHRC